MDLSPGASAGRYGICQEPSVLSTPTVHGILATLPGLARDADFWLRIMDTLEDKSEIGELLESHAAPHQILADFQVMTAACRHDPRILMLLEDQPLGVDRRFWQGLLVQDPAALIYMAPEAQRRFPDLVVQTFAPLAEHPDCDWEVCETVCGNMAEDLWDDGMARQWLEAGLPFVSGARPFPGTFCERPRDLFDHCQEVPGRGSDAILQSSLGNPTIRQSLHAKSH